MDKCMFNANDKCYNREKHKKIFSKNIPAMVIKEGMNTSKEECEGCNDIKISKRLGTK